MTTLDASVPPVLLSGDRVRLVSPASPPIREYVDRGVELLTAWGLEVELGKHVFDRFGYLAGRDKDRLTDLDEAFRDRGVRAIFATRGGKGAYRIASALDFGAARSDPKPLVGFSDITHLHLAYWRRSRLVGVHGHWYDQCAGPEPADALRAALMMTEPITIQRDPDEPTAALSTRGTASGFLMGGNLDALRTAVGAQLPSLDGAVLLIEAVMGTGLGQIDREFSQLLNSGSLAGVRGVAVGQFTGFDGVEAGGWTVLDVLRDRLDRLGVPVLGGLPLGHGRRPRTVPLGTPAILDAEAGTLQAEPAVCRRP